MQSERGQSAGDGPDAPRKDDILRALDSVLASRRFQGSDRISAFLRHVVVETLEGRGDLLKAYSIATDVFGRRDFKDDSNDSIVRTSAHRLRQLLDEYYRDEGADRDWRIVLPKGGYVPRFEPRAVETNVIYIAPPDRAPPVAQSQPRRGLPRHWPHYLGGLLAVAVVALVMVVVLRPRVEAFQPTPPRISVRTVATGAISGSAASDLQALVISDLVSFGSTTVLEGTAVPPPASDASHYSLTISLRGAPDAVEAVWTLTDVETGVTAWTGRERVGVLSNERLNRTSEAIAGRLLGHDGALLLVDSAKWGPNDPRRCTSDAQRRGNRIYDDNQRTLDCLTRLLERQPNDAQLWAQLSLVNYRLATGVPRTDAEAAPYFAQQSRALARAVELAPQAYFTKIAQYSDAHARRDGQAMDRIAAELLETYAGYPSLRTTLSIRMAISGRTDEAQRLIAEKAAMGGELLPLDHAILAMACYQEGDFGCARREVDLVPEDRNALLAVLRIGAHSQTGDREKAARLWAELVEIYPGYETLLRADLTRQSLPPEAVELLIDGVRKAGVRVP